MVRHKEVDSISANGQEREKLVAVLGTKHEISFVVDRFLHGGMPSRR